MGISPSLVRQPKIESPARQGDILDFLCLPESYPEHTNHVRVVQTTHAWVFLTETFAYKLKKPSRHQKYDFSSLKARRYLCNEEVRLNRRFARDTYLGVVPVVIGRDRRLTLDGDGTTVDWLVKMRRLPRNQFLNIAAIGGRVTDNDLSRVMRKLHRLYIKAPVCGMRGTSYPDRLQSELAQTQMELLMPKFQLSPREVNEIVDRQQRYVRIHTELLEARQHDDHVREIHGDLRPEHICLMPNADPEIIDCLEFDRHLRCLDCVEEISFFGLECRVLGQAWIEKKCIDWYQSNSGDPVRTHLWCFYAARRATTRAMLCAWHELDGTSSREWTRRAQEYLWFASRYLDSAAIN